MEALFLLKTMVNGEKLNEIRGLRMIFDNPADRMNRSINIICIIDYFFSLCQIV